jgi:hypothetical protein
MTAVPITNQLDRKRQRGFTAGSVGVGAENHCSNRTGHVGQAKRAKGEQHGYNGVRVREKCAGDAGRKVPVNEDVEPFQRIANGSGSDLERPAGGLRRGRDQGIKGSRAGQERSLRGETQVSKARATHS